MVIVRTVVVVGANIVIIGNNLIYYGAFLGLAVFFTNFIQDYQPRKKSYLDLIEKTLLLEIFTFV